jgi:hypothetical protein
MTQMTTNEMTTKQSLFPETVFSERDISILLEEAPRAAPTLHKSWLDLLAMGELVPDDMVWAWLDSCGIATVRKLADCTLNPSLVTIYTRPSRGRSLGRDVQGFTALEFVVWLLNIWRLGIDAGAREAVAAFQPTLQHRRFLTEDEFWVWRGPKTMNRREPFVVATSLHRGTITMRLPQQVVGRSGYRLTAGFDKDDYLALVGAPRREAPGWTIAMSLPNAGSWYDWQLYQGQRRL